MERKLDVHRLLIGLVAGTFFASAETRADFIVTPNAQANAEGDSFFIKTFQNESSRFQQVIAASEFASVGGPFRITQVSFRPDGDGGVAFTDTYQQFRLDLTTTSQAPNALSGTFGDNLGADDTVVFNGPLTLSSANLGPAGGPKAFDIVIPLQVPFVYNPDAGNLLIDLRRSGSVSGLVPGFDAVTSVDGGINRSTSYIAATAPFGAANATTSDAGGTGGYVIRFTVSIVPEPPSLVLALLGLGVLGTYSSYVRRATRYGHPERG